MHLHHALFFGLTAVLLAPALMAQYSLGYYLVVGYGDLYLLNQPSIWYLIGARPAHGNSVHFNHWTTLATNNGLNYATRQYLSDHQQCKVCVNDSALPFGGKFDLHVDWNAPHIEHDRGTAVDLATTLSRDPAECTDAAFVINDPNAMVNDCLGYGAFRAQYETSPRHVHCNWQNPATYPH